MSTLSDRLYAQARITPIRKPNQVKSVQKLAGGALRVINHGGESYDIGVAVEAIEADREGRFGYLNAALSQVHGDGGGR